MFAIKQKPRICEAFAFQIRSSAIVTEGQSRATDGARPNNASIVACKLFNLQGEFRFGVRKKRKSTNKVRAYLFVVRSTQNKWCCRTSCFALDTACPICLLCPLRSMSANALRLRLSLLAVSRAESELRINMRRATVLHASLGVRKKRKNTNKVRAYLFVVRSPRLELGRCNHTPLKRTRLPIPP